MSKQKDLKEMRSYLLVLVIHVVKIHVEERVVGSWQNSIRYSVKKIKELRKDYLDIDAEIEDVLPGAIGLAAGEVWNGVDEELIWEIIKPKLIISHCKSLIDM